MDVQKIVSDFNKDLSQLSHKLCLLYSNKLHLFAVHCIWKLQID